MRKASAGDTYDSLRRDLAASRKGLLSAIAGVSEEQFKRRGTPAPGPFPPSTDSGQAGVTSPPGPLSPSTPLRTGLRGEGEQSRVTSSEVAPDEPAWSISEVLAHLLQQERLRAERIAAALRQDGVTIVPSDAEAHREGARAGRVAPVPQIIHGLLASRRRIEKLLDEAEALPGGLERGVTHPVRGRETVAWMLRAKLIEHEQEHLAQIEALKRGLGTGDRQRGTGSRQQATGSRQQATGNRQQATGVTSNK